MNDVLKYIVSFPIIIISTIYSLFHRNKVNPLEVHINNNDWQNYEIIIESIMYFLDRSNNVGQYKVMEEILQSVKLKDKYSFLAKIHTANVWGGSGAVWEVWFDNKDYEDEFQKQIIKLCELLEENGNNQGYIRSRKKLFEKEIKSRLTSHST